MFLGLSAPRVLKPEWLGRFAPKPLILALANPEPEILPEAVRAARPDAIVATGRSDYPNQVNNVLCFPFIFRGALDVGATTINEAMKLAAVEAIAELARVEASEVVAAAYGGAAPVFGPDYIIPKPFDPRLILEIAPAVARAAMDVRRRAPADRRFRRLPARAGALRLPLRPAHAPGVRARQGRTRRGWSMPRARTSACCARCRPWSTTTWPRPILIGRRGVIERRVRELGLRMDLGESVQRARSRPGRGGVRPAGGGIPAPGGAPRRAARGRRAPRAHPPHRRRGAAAARRPGRCRDLRRQRRLVAAHAVHHADHPASARRSAASTRCPA